VVATEWYAGSPSSPEAGAARAAFGVVTRGGAPELRAGESWWCSGRHAGFWLGGTAVHARRNSNRPTATVRIVTPRARTVTCQSPHPCASYLKDEEHMNSMKDSGGVEDPASSRTSHTRRLRGLVVTGFVAALAAMMATSLAAALAQALEVDFEVPDGGETIPLTGFAVVTGVFSVVGIVIAVALLRWSARPAERFVWTAVSLTAISLVPPVLSGANTATTVALVGLHLVAATVMIPTLARSLRTA
jgi:hypothetical protein